MALVVQGTYLACRRIIYLLYCTKLRSVYFSSSLRVVQGTQRSNVEHAPMDHFTAGCANLLRKNSGEIILIHLNKSTKLKW